PLARDLKVVDVSVRHVRRRAGIQCRYGLGNHVLHGVLRKLDPDLGLVLELLDRGEERVVLGLVKAFYPPDGERFLRQRLPRESQHRTGDDAGDESFHASPPSLLIDRRFGPRPKPAMEYGFINRISLVTSPPPDTTARIRSGHNRASH